MDKAEEYHQNYFEKNLQKVQKFIDKFKNR